MTGSNSARIDLPLVPDPPKVKRVTTAPTVQVYYGIDPTPMFRERNPAFTGNVEPDPTGAYHCVRGTELTTYADKLQGLAPVFFVTNGTMRQATCWHDGTTFRDLAPVANRFNIDESLGGAWDDPMTDGAIKAICDLARNATRYGCKCPTLLDIVVDIESTKTYHTGDLATRIAAYTAAIRTFRNYSGEDRGVYFYQFPGFNVGSVELSPDLAAADRAMMRMLSGIHLGGYAWDLTIENVETWFEGFHRLLGQVRTAYPFHSENIHVTLYPYQQMYYGAHPDQDNKPIPMATWTRIVDCVVAEQVNPLLWCGGGQARLGPVDQQIEYLAKYARWVN